MPTVTPGGNPYAFELAGRSFLVTGGAGFIGSHIVRRLVGAGASVRVLDNFSTGQRANLAAVADRIELIEGDITDAALVRQAVDGAEYVLHLAALASVPESVAQPTRNFEINLAGMHNLLMAARDAQVQRLVFSSSAAVYGDHAAPHHEELAPRALSPYAAAKHSGEQLCRSFTHAYGLPTVCLRYFNVFGPGQNPRSGYAAAIPIFINALLEGKRPTIFGDGHQSRDFVYVANVVDANLLACGTEAAIGGVFNIGAGGETTLLELLALLSELADRTVEPIFAAGRVGDIRHSFSDISRAEAVLGYRTRVGLAEGLHEAFAWYREHGATFWT
jgi:nucleoside-diphosphate-sugar epimerase